MATIIKKERRSPAYQRTTSISNKNLINFVSDRNRKSLKDLKGKISFRDDYDYKSIRK
jgi:hypothetical protein